MSEMGNMTEGKKKTAGYLFLIVGILGNVPI